MRPEKISKPSVIFQNQYLKLYSQIANFGDYDKEFFITEFGPRAGVLVMKDDLVLLVRQYRLLIDRPSWEIPGGKVEEGETKEEAAAKECLEETGVRCRSLKFLFQYYPGTECVDNPTYIYFSEDFEEGGKIKDQREIESCVWKPFSECLEMILKGEIVDGLTVIALLAYAALNSKKP